MKNQLIIDTPPGNCLQPAAEAETVAEADYDFSGPLKPRSLARRCRASIQRPRIQPGWRLCNPIPSAPGSARTKKNSKPSLSVDFHQALGNLRGAIGLFGWRQSRFRRPSWVMGAFVRSATLGSTRSAMRSRGWRIARRTDPVVDRRWHRPVHRLERRQNVFRHRDAAYAEPRAQGQPCKELIPCLSPHVVQGPQDLKAHRGGSRLARNDDPPGQDFAVS